MNRTNRIRVFCLTTLMSVCLSFYLGYEIMQDWKDADRQEEYLAEKVTEQETDTTEEATELSIANMEIPYEYVIVEEEGYLMVYMKDLETVYMYTDIRIEELPESLRQEIRKGKPFSDLKELYDFLENYSS